MAFVDYCPPAVIEKVREADLSKAENGTLFSWIAGVAPLDCQVSAVVEIAGRMTARTHPSVIDDFCGSVATYARFLTPEGREAITSAYLRLPYYDFIAVNYFNGLRLTGIDIREYLRKRVPEDWSFTHPRRDAATWHYYLYLASLGEPGALDALARKLADTRSGNDLTNLLDSLAELPGDGVTAILGRYADDPRTADGTEGPGTPVAQTVAVLLALRGAQ